eukprot:4584327-Pleurochrysis_carterae.AAC.3
MFHPHTLSCSSRSLAGVPLRLLVHAACRPTLGAIKGFVTVYLQNSVTLIPVRKLVRVDALWVVSHRFLVWFSKPSTTPSRLPTRTFSRQAFPHRPPVSALRAFSWPFFLLHYQPLPVSPRGGLLFWHSENDH